MPFVRFVVAAGFGAVISLSPLLEGIVQSSIPLSSSKTSALKDALAAEPAALDLPLQPVQVQIQTVKSLTLMEAIALAEKNNKDLEIGRLELQRTQAALRQARAALFPTLSGEADLAYDRSAQERLNDLKYEGLDAPSTGVGAGKVEISYDLFTSGKRSAQIRAATAQVQLAQLELERLQAQIRLDVTNAYYDIQQADQQVRITQTALKNIQRLLQDAENLEVGGIGTRFDVIRTRVQLGNAEQELIEAQVQQEISRRQMVQLLSLEESVDVSAADPVQVTGNWQLSLEESIVQAYQNRVELPQQIQERTIAQQQRRAEIAGVLPKLSLFANYQFLNEFVEPFGTLDGYAAGVRVRWTFFDGGASFAAADQQKANRAIAETRFVQTRNQIRFQVEQAYKTLQANARSIQTASAAFKEAQEALDIAQFRFARGVGTQLDVITAENDLTRADVNRLRAILNYNRALAALQRAVSNPLTPSATVPISGVK